MATTLPALSGAEAVRAFERLGWTVVRQRGSHAILTKPGHRATLSVPDHATVAKGTLRALIRNAGCSVDEFAHVARQ